MKNIVKRLSIIALSLILTTGLLVGCGSGDTKSSSSNSSEQHSEMTHEDDHHSEESHHEDEGHEDHHDENRADHFQGKEANTYDEAITNIKEANGRLEKLLAKDELGGTDFTKIHRMSYTMENALKVIRENSDKDLQDVAENLEKFHLASEKRDAETVRQAAEKYLNGIQPILEGK